MTFMRKFLDMLKIDNANPQGIKTNVSDVSSLNDGTITPEVMDHELPSESTMPNSLECASHEVIANDPEPKSDMASNICMDTENSEICYEENSFDEEEFIEEDSFEEDELIEEDIAPYKSKRMVINGVHLYFIDVAREIVEQKFIDTIPLMREYRLSESELHQIIQELQDAGILDSDKNVTMCAEELEKFFDIYEPSLFDCNHTVFDKEIFMCIGEIIFDHGVKDTYNSLPANEVVDYLNIMEELKIIQYNNQKNEYLVLTSKEEFYKISECIPSSFAKSDYSESDDDYQNVNPDNLSGIEFEKYCAHILLLNKYTNIKMTPPSGDHGIDILAEKDGITYAIQCKCYSSNVGNAAVQQAHTGKSLYHKDIAVVMTNHYFTSQAIEESKELGVKLWDRDKLNEMIQNIRN